MRKMAIEAEQFVDSYKRYVPWRKVLKDNIITLLLLLDIHVLNSLNLMAFCINVAFRCFQSESKAFG